MSRASRVVVLAEGARDQAFVRGYLRRLGYSNHEIRWEPVSGGIRGSGENWVRTRYAKNVQAFRRRSARAATALVVMIDADTGSVAQRAEQLRDCLQQAALAPRRDDERIAHLIPKRAVESWILCLNGHTVDEETDYRNDRRVEGDVASAAIKFYELTRRNTAPPPGAVPSLLMAVPEVRRLEEE